ncbi:hypothetical protein O0I10_004818 [Lichtheimia ornata]|uniref:Uncharacterized protein n=1 Tax=Lichtheimia ornata TaxID=688661 RepID=A0AAD7Y078_9FUNG|nr:uncharacterized protein O0I10_004818 [Lichtheimia ornata]KAJ8659453.1 hypothetical protein O0I10_004818 [Lichtheimia ornata]
MPIARKAVHLQITSKMALRVILHIMDQDWYEEEQLYSHVIQALYGTIVRFLVNDKHGLSLAKRRKELENTKSLDQARFRLVYRFLWQETHRAMILRQNKKYNAITVYPFELAVVVDKPNTQKNLESYFVTYAK